MSSGVRALAYAPLPKCSLRRHHAGLAQQATLRDDHGDRHYQIARANTSPTSSDEMCIGDCREYPALRTVCGRRTKRFIRGYMPNIGQYSTSMAHQGSGSRGALSY
eukprot:2758281-Pleurochrysis_carterae.AAC.1